METHYLFFSIREILSFSYALTHKVKETNIETVILLENEFTIYYTLAGIYTRHYRTYF